mmetsp:Transcript_25451/g.60087  ORF Transcript_25451/g.60087 Transcript_25451/m.60087 type:complete len:122 (-) Transcript_25451:21-386(-)
MSPSQLCSAIRKEAAFDLKVAVAFGLMGLCVLLSAQVKRLRLRARLGDSRTASRSPAPGSGPGECVVCCRYACDAVFLECGHQALCVTCANQLVENETTPGTSSCPICRTKISRVVRVYMP